MNINGAIIIAIMAVVFVYAIQLHKKEKTFILPKPTGAYAIGMNTMQLIDKNIENNQQTILIQGISQVPIIASIIKNITPFINDIIKDELGLPKNYDFSFFMPKELYRITLYSMHDIDENNDSIIITKLDSMRLMQWKPFHVSVTSNIDFFGDQHDELVVLINDSEKKLEHLNQKIKQTMHDLNDEYSKIHKQKLYSISKSEKYSFLPHMGLGRIRLQSIKNHIKNESETDAIVERIRQCIKKVVVEFMQKALTTENQKIFFDKIAILDLQKREYIKEWYKNE